MKKLKLPPGFTYCHNGEGKKICAGSAMGRRDVLPENAKAPIKLRMERLRWVDGDYDQWGAYWGNSGGSGIYCAWGDGSGEKLTIYVFVRAPHRSAAKESICHKLPEATFYR